MRGPIGAALMLSLGLAGCATTYGEIGGWEGDGVSADQLTADTFRIRGRGNGATEPAQVQDFVMLRAAETARAHCFTHFVVLEGADRTEVDEGVTPEEHTTKVVERVVDGKKEKIVTHSFTPGTSWVTVRPGQDLIVRGLIAGPGQAPADAVDAGEVLAFVGPRVERRKGEPLPTFPACPAQA